MFSELLQRIVLLEKQLNLWRTMRVDQDRVLPKAIKQSHIDGLIIHTGLAADRPDGSTHVKVWYATDTFALSIYTGSAWKSVTLS